MINEEIKSRLEEAYKSPNKKFCFFTGQNDKRISDALGIEQWDWTPQKTINIEPYYWNTHTIPLTFGCKPKFTSEGNEWIENLISDPKQVYDIKIPEIYSGRTGEIFNYAKKILKDYPENNLIRLPDIQSPLGVCELMWDQTFYMALLTNPEEIKNLLDKVTEFIIKYVKEFQDILGERYNPSCHPHLWSSREGYYISDDANSMVSPDMHYELSIEYINKISAECGPVFYHSCTFTDQYIENIKKVENVKAINWSVGTSKDPAEIIKEFSGKTILAPHIGKNIHEEESIVNLQKGFSSEVDVVRYFLESMNDNTAMNIVLHDGLLEDVETVVKIYNLFNEFGYTYY